MTYKYNHMLCRKPFELKKIIMIQHQLLFGGCGLYVVLVGKAVFLSFKEKSIHKYNHSYAHSY